MKISRLRRTLAVFLSAMLVLLCMPMMALTASAADVISEVTVIVDTSSLPTSLIAGQSLTGEEANRICSSFASSGYYFNESCSFSSFCDSSGNSIFNEENSTFAPFELGQSYYFRWRLIIDNYDTTFAPNGTLKVKVSGTGSELTYERNSDTEIVVIYPLGTAVDGPAEYTITLNYQDGTTPNGSQITSGGKLASLPTPSREGFTFKGWFTAATDGTPVTTSTTFSGNDTIYAQWEAVSTDSKVISAVTVNVDTTALPTELVAGKEPNISSVKNAFSIPVDANYSIYDCVIADINIENYNSYVPGINYYMWLVIEADTNYSFDENVTASSADGNLINMGLNYEDNLIVGYPIGTVVMDPNYVPDGYTSDTNKIMAYTYRYNSYNSYVYFDIQGKFNGNWRPTTYSNEGYFTKVKAGDDVYDVSAAPFASAETLENGLKVGIDLDFVNNGNQLKVVYTVENTGAEAINYALASAADVQIGDDDGAVITPFSDAMGFKMVSRGGYSNDDYVEDYPLDHYTKPDGTEDYAQFNFFGDSKYSGVTGVSALWYGYYNYVNDNDALFGYGEADCQTAADGEYLDSGMIWRWDNNTIGAGETKTFSILIGIGGAGSENVVPSDPSEPTHTHKFGEWTIVKEATTTEEGLLERVCECGEKETKVIDKLVDTDKDNDNGNVVDITPDDNAGGAALDDIEDVAENIPLEPEEYIAIQEGEDLKIYLEVVDVTDASETMPEADKALIEEKINSVNNMKQGMLIDVSLFKKVGNGESTKVTNTKAPIQIVFEMPESLINKNSNVVRKYYIIRVHEGVADTLDGSFDVASKKFTFETDRFSSYAIAYTDYAIGSPSIPSAPGSSESSSNKHTHNYVWKNDSTSHWQMCNCGGVNDKGAHTFGDWETVKEPTETEDGIKKHTCTVCGYSETGTIEDVSSGAGDVVANDTLEVTEKDITLAITFIISAAVIGMTIAKRRRVSK